jgi:hypothetical protein
METSPKKYRVTVCPRYPQVQKPPLEKKLIIDGAGADSIDITNS